MLRILHRPVTRFVTFHDIMPEAVGYFKRNLYFLKKSTNVVSLDDFFSARLSSKKINVVITFDDGYKSWPNLAIPQLQKFRLPATFFVTSGFVGLSKKNEVELMRSRLFLTHGSHRKIVGLSFEDLKEIAAKGFTIGGHTLNHCNLGKLQDISQVKYEINEDKLRLENITGLKVEYFAYPSGAYYNSRINLINVLKESGYRGALTTVPGFNDAKSNPFLLCRELTRAMMPAPVFRARVCGNYDPVLFIKKRVLKILH